MAYSQEVSIAARMIAEYGLIVEGNPRVAIMARPQSVDDGIRLFYHYYRTLTKNGIAPHAEYSTQQGEIIVRDTVTNEVLAEVWIPSRNATNACNAINDYVMPDTPIVTQEGMSYFASRLSGLVSFELLYDSNQYGKQNRMELIDMAKDLLAYDLKLSILECPDDAHIQINAIRHGLSVWSGRSYCGSIEFMSDKEAVSLLTCALIDVANSAGVDYTLSTKG